jgi:hypothetical protein
MRGLFEKFFDFGNEHFNVILVALVLTFLLAITLHVIHDGRDATAVQWIENLTGQFASALLTLLVANKVMGGGGGGTGGAGGAGEGGGAGGPGGAGSKQ